MGFISVFKSIDNCSAKCIGIIYAIYLQQKADSIILRNPEKKSLIYYEKRYLRKKFIKFSRPQIMFYIYYLLYE